MYAHFCVQMALSPKWVLLFFHPLPPSPRPAPLLRDAVVKEFVKISLSGLVHAPLKGPPEPERAWAPPPIRATLPKHSMMNRTSFMARPLCVFLAAQLIRCTQDTKDPVSLAALFPRLCTGCAVFVGLLLERGMMSGLECSINSVRIVQELMHLWALAQPRRSPVREVL